MRRRLATFLCALCAGGCSHVTSQSKPAPDLAAVPIRVTSGSEYVDTGVIRHAGASWLATAVATATRPNTVRIYRWTGARWSLDGVVPVPQTPPLNGGGYLTASSLTRSGAPDFALSTFGADTHWFAVISRIRGKWRTVPFDYRRGPSIGIDARGVSENLVRAEVNGCGCAAGPETYSWYRFDGSMFVPTEPPGPAADCSAAALESARPLVVGRVLDVEVQGDLRSPFDVARFACADGWALATGTKRGKRALALFEQRGGVWLRDAVGAQRAIRIHADEFALANSVLWQLAARIREPLGRRPRPYQKDSYAPDAAGLRGEPRWERTSVRIAVTPGSGYADSRVVYRHGRKWLVVAVEAKPDGSGRRHVLNVHVYRWTRTSWTKQGTVHLEVATAHREEPLRFVDSASLTGSDRPDFTVGPSVPFPSWLAAISGVGGRWRTIPFRTSRGVSVAVDAFPVRGKLIESYEGPMTKISYRFRRGSFEIYRREPAPRCDPELFGRLAEPPIRVTRAACGFGWALAAGKRKARPVVALFEALDTRWLWLETSAPSQVGSFESADGIPSRLLKQLAGRIGKG